MGALVPDGVKGNLVNIPEWGGGRDGNVNEPGSAGPGPGKSFLFFLKERQASEAV